MKRMLLFFGLSLFSLTLLSMTGEAVLTGSFSVKERGDCYTITLIGYAKCFQNRDDALNSLNQLIQSTTKKIEELWPNNSPKTEGPDIAQYRSYKDGDPCHNTWEGQQVLTLTFDRSEEWPLNRVFNQINLLASQNDQSSTGERSSYLEVGKPAWHLNQDNIARLQKKALEGARLDAQSKFETLMGNSILQGKYFIKKVDMTEGIVYSKAYARMESLSDGSSGVFINSDDRLDVAISATFTFSYEPLIMSRY